MNSDDLSRYIVEFFDGLSPDLTSLYDDVKERDLSGWATGQVFESGFAGALLATIPVAGYLTLPADFLKLARQMTVIVYGTGAIIGHQRFGSNLLEKEDFAAVLGIWTGQVDLANSSIGKISSDLITKVGSKTAAKTLAKTMCKHTGVLVGQQLSGKVGAKIGAKLGAKLGVKAATRWMPVFSMIVSGGVNMYIINSIGKAAEEWYRFKAR